MDKSYDYETVKISSFVVISLAACLIIFITVKLYQISLSYFVIFILFILITSILASLCTYVFKIPLMHKTKIVLARETICLPGRNTPKEVALPYSNIGKISHANENYGMSIDLISGKGYIVRAANFKNKASYTDFKEEFLKIIQSSYPQIIIVPQR